MFCNYCGASLPDDAQFCGACGKSLVQADPGQSNAPVEEAPAAPVQETPSAPEMLYDVSESAPDAAPVPVKPKRNIKRILIAVVAAVVALGIIGGGIAFAMDYFSPEKTLDRAMDKTSDAMSELFEALPGLTRMGENYENLAKSDVLDTRVSLDAADSYESFNVTMHEVFSKKDDLHGFVEFSGQFDGMEIAFEGYVDKDAIQMAAPSLVSGRYALPLAKAGGKLHTGWEACAAHAGNARLADDIQHFLRAEPFDGVPLFHIGGPEIPEVIFNDHTHAIYAAGCGAHLNADDRSGN